jgi:hypothetical protein
MPAPDLPPFTTDLFVPAYRSARHGDWELRCADFVLCPGYWSDARLVTGMAALLRGGRTWMSLAPLEIESQEIGVRLAAGNVVIFGLGMGWCAAATALRAQVSRVTVVECDPDVLALHRELDIFAQLPPVARDKIGVEKGDAFTWRPSQPVDLLMPDIWLPLVSDGRVEEVRRMQANVAAAGVYFWGQELEIARHAVAAGRALDEAGIDATIADFGLPLVGPRHPGYAGKLAAAARRWMGDRWLPGSPASF